MSGERAVRGLGEVALRVNDLSLMQRFYEDVVGLELMQRFDDAAFFRIADGFGGHTQILALFDRNREGLGQTGPQAEATTLDHLALEIPLDAYKSEKARLESRGVSVRTREFEWVHWRSLFVEDPEGNVVELVCYDPDVV